jgi:hypothetical protein
MKHKIGFPFAQHKFQLFCLKTQTKKLARKVTDKFHSINYNLNIYLRTSINSFMLMQRSMN